MRGELGTFLSPAGLLLPPFVLPTNEKWVIWGVSLRRNWPRVAEALLSPSLLGSACLQRPLTSDSFQTYMNSEGPVMWETWLWWSSIFCNLSGWIRRGTGAENWQSQTLCVSFVSIKDGILVSTCRFFYLISHLVQNLSREMGYYFLVSPSTPSILWYLHFWCFSSLLNKSSTGMGRYWPFPLPHCLG